VSLVLFGFFGFFVVGQTDVSRPLEFPTTPEVILDYHRQKPFLNNNEEWLVVELNEYECLVDGFEILKIIAKHSKFFEVVQMMIAFCVLVFIHVLYRLPATGSRSPRIPCRQSAINDSLAPKPNPNPNP